MLEGIFFFTLKYNIASNNFLNFSSFNYLKSTETPSKKIITVVKQLKTKITQEKFETKMINFFLHSMIPLRCVEDPYFLKMFDALNISDCGLCVLSRLSFCRKIDVFYEKNKNEIKEELKDVQFVCTTVDIWSRKKKFSRSNVSLNFNK